MVTYPKDWKMTTLGAAGTFTKGAPLSKADISDTGTPFVLYGELYTTYGEVTYKIYRHTSRKVEPVYYSRVGDVIIPTSGETAEEIATSCCIMVPGAILAGDLNIYRAEGFDGRFVSYVINHVVNRQIADVAQGISIMHINAKKLKKIEFFYPEFPEQKAIADVLDDFDNHIADLAQLIEKKKAIRDGALADLMSRKTRLNGFSSEWINIPFDKYFMLLKNNTYAREKLSDHGSVGNIHYGDVLVEYGDVVTAKDNIPFLKEDVPYSPSWLLQENDIVIADTAEDETVGKAVQMEKIPYPVVAGLHTISCRPNMETAPGFLGYYINSKCYHDQLLPYITGIKVSSISKKAIKTTEICVPSDIGEQEAIVEVLSAMDSEIVALETEREKMIQIREGAMDDLLTGRVRLRTEGRH